jgi:hypothetical protein
LLEVAIANAGMRKGMRATQFALEWAIVVADQGQLPEGVTAQLRTYVDWWGENERSAWRHLDEFRQAFPGLDTPAELAAELAPRFADVVEKGRQLQKQRRRASLARSIMANVTAPIAA